MRTMIKNRVHSVLHRRGILTPKDGLFSRDGRKFLDELTLDDAGQAISKRYLTALDQFESLIDQSDKDLRRVMRRPRWAGPAALLQTMPGIGVITALTILAELGDLKRFKSRAAVANYAGLVPVIRDSNTKHYSGGITHCGSSHLRAVLSEAAWTAVSRVPVYQALFERIAQRRGKQTAIVAVARRMLEDAVRMLWKGEAFRFVPVMSDAVKAASNVHGTPCSDSSIPAAQAVKIEVASSVAG
jgi:transposase